MGKENFRILFVASGNRFKGINPIIKAQAESLSVPGVSVEFFPVLGKGISGYAKSVFRLRRFLKQNNKYDLVHAHYSFSGFLSAFAGAKPLVVSLMGSDLRSRWHIFPIRLVSYLFWDSVIVKSEGMKNSLGLKRINVIPNGVDMSLFQPIDKNIALERLQWDRNIHHIVFGSDHSRDEKNFKSLAHALITIKDYKIEIHSLKNVPHPMVNFYLNACDLVTLPSLWEGSPNIIKEAMACNCPIVATDVGDISWVTDKVEGCFLTSGELQDYSRKLQLAISFSINKGRTLGRERINKLKLDDLTVSGQILNLYKKIISMNSN